MRLSFVFGQIFYIILLGMAYYKYTYSNILTNLDYGAKDVRNLARVQIDRALSTRRSRVLSARSICTRARLRHPRLRNLNELRIIRVRILL